MISNIQPDINRATDRMFVETADQNYIMARSAFMNHMNVDFFWLTAQTVEKYLKAILLKNDRKVQKHGHNLMRLYRSTINLDRRLSFGPLQRPSPLPNQFWKNMSIEEFLERLNEMGSPHNRYMIYGYALAPSDIFITDQLVWEFRRHARPLIQTNSGTQIDWVHQLKHNRQLWKLNGTHPIEKCVAGKCSDAVIHGFSNMNFWFAPTYYHDYSSLRFSSAIPPLADYAQRLESPNATKSTKDVSAETLEWALNSITLAQKDKDEIERLLVKNGYKIPKHKRIGARIFHIPEWLKEIVQNIFN